MCDCHQVDLQATEEILRRYPAESRHLMSVLQDVQLAYRYLPRPALERVADTLGVPLARVYGVATFYKAFSLTPRNPPGCPTILEMWSSSQKTAKS